MADKETKLPSFALAMRDFFGLKEMQKIGDFALELKNLSEEERDYFKRLLSSQGVKFA